MEHESFENEAIARVLNEHFVAIKVDREERPDLDQIYMNAVQMLTGHGGWPMSVFLTPELKPFYGGTYWPPTSSARHAGVRSDSRGGDRRLEESPRAGDHGGGSAHGRDCRRSARRSGSDASALSLDLIDAAATSARADRSTGRTAASARRRSFRTRWICSCCCGVLAERSGRGPLDMVRLTLDRMAAGGIYDHLGGGFARYSVDARGSCRISRRCSTTTRCWRGRTLDAYLVTGDENYARVVRETLDYVLRDMTDPAAGFTAPRTPTAKAKKGCFTRGRRTRSTRCSATERGATFGRVYRRDGRRQFRRAAAFSICRRRSSSVRRF